MAPLDHPDVSHDCAARDLLEAPRTFIDSSVVIPWRSPGRSSLKSSKSSVAVRTSPNTKPEVQVAGEIKKKDNIKARSNNPAQKVEDAQSSKIKKKSSSEGRLSMSQFEDKVSKIIPITNEEPGPGLSDTDFNQITLLLRQADHEEWSFRPRTYALLRMINATGLIDDFVERNCLDIALPYSSSNLPWSLSQDQREQFIKLQRAIMTKAANLEGGSQGKHANFECNADSHLKSLNLIGKGGYGKVDRVRSKLSRKIYVRKRMKRSETFEETAQALWVFQREVKHLKRLSHRHLVRYVGSYTDPEYVGIIMEPVADMDLAKFLSKVTVVPEYVGESHCGTMIEWLRGLPQELDIDGATPTEPTVMHCDNQAAIGMAEKAQFSKKTKHIAIRYHYVRDLVKDSVIEMVFMPTAEMIADGLTKAVGKEKFKRFVQALNMAS